MNSQIRHFIELLFEMTKKELHTRYKHTFFGFLWIALNPIIQMTVIGFIFTFFMKEPIEHYYYHLLIGLLVWNFFSQSLTKTTPSLVYERALIKKAKFPHAVIPLSLITSNAVHFIIAFVLLCFLAAYLGTMTGVSIAYILTGTLLLLTITTGTSLLTSALNVQYRDVNFFVQALLLVWFYATPIVYSLSQMPLHVQWMWRFNPLTIIVQIYQHALIGSLLPEKQVVIVNFIIIMLLTVLGTGVFIQKSKTFDDWV